MGAPPPDRSASPLRIGAETGGPSPQKSFQGTIDEMATYAGNLSAGIMTAHFDRLKANVGK